MRLGLIVTMAAITLAAQEANPLTTTFLNSLKSTQRNLEETAELMPEEGYSFRPTPETRPFGEWIEHTAASHYSFCSQIKGEARPDVAHLMQLKTKAEIVRALKDSYQYCADAVKGMDDQKALAQVRPIMSLIASDNEHYGNLVVYLRLKGLVPPSTARAQKAQPPAAKK